MADSKSFRSNDASDHPSGRQPLFWHTSFGWCLLSLVLFWLSFPPVNWWLLAWVAPIGWIRAIRLQQLGGRRPLSWLYAMGWIHWLSMTYWVTLPHPLAAVGWLFLAAYLATFVVGFILLARWLVHRNHVSTVFAVPVAWVTMEILRTRLFTGFGLVSLSHSQVDFHSLLQISSFVGAYGVSFVVVMCAAAMEQAFSAFIAKEAKASWVSLIVAAAVFGICVGFGNAQLRREPDASGAATVAIIQGTLDTEFGDNMDARNHAFADYSRMTSEVTAKADIDLVVWPESMFWKYGGIVKYDAELASKDVGHEMTMETLANVYEVSTKQHIQLFGTKCLLGSSTTYYHLDSLEHYNTAALYDENGDLAGAYHKMHPVMFGEYIPFGDVMPWLYNFAPIPGALTPGEEPKSFNAGSISFSPLICFENTVPQLVRRQIIELQKRGESPDALVTLTNDGWFWGSSLLDVHLACGIYRAVENRRPMLISANTGISAYIDDRGRVLQSTPKQKSRVIVAEVAGCNVRSYYTQFGDWFGFGCVTLSAIGLFVGRFYS